MFFNNLYVEKQLRINRIRRQNFEKQMRKVILFRFHNVASKPALLYGSKCWTVGRTNEIRTEVAQMRCLHP